MVAAGAVLGVPAGVGVPPREWWQVWAERRARWWERHQVLRRRVSVVRTVGLWVGLCYLLVVAVAWPERLLGMTAWVGACLGAVAWFFLARTKTLTWSGFMRFFAVCGVWSVGVALVLAMVSSWLGNAGVDAVGPTVFVAGLGEEALKLVPLVALAVAAPRRVSRFAAVDWWLLGLAAGLAFEVVEEGARRVFLLSEMQRQGLLAEYRDLYGGGVPEGMTTFGLLPSDWSHEGAGYAGHAVATGMVAALVGLVVVVWRWGRGRGAAGWAWRAAAAVVPVVCLTTMMADHLAFNAHADDQVLAGGGAWLDPAVSAVPWWLRVPWSLFGHGQYRVVWFVLLFVVCLAVDGYRLGARPASSLSGQPMGPSLGAAVGRLWVLRGWWGRVWAVVATSVLATGWVVGRDLGQVAAAHVRGAGEPVRAAMRRGAVAASTARGLREAAMDQSAGPVRPARTRLVAVSLGAVLLVVALWVAPHLAAGAGEGLLRPDGGWLPAVLTSLSEYWNSLPLAKQLAIELALGAMFALMMGPIGWGVAGVLTWGLAHGAGIVTFARDPRAATNDYLANLTPAQAGADLLDLALTFAPGNFASGSRAIARSVAHQATLDPVAVVAARRHLIDNGLPAHAATPTHAVPSTAHANQMPGAHPSTHPTAGTAYPAHPQASPVSGPAATRPPTTAHATPAAHPAGPAAGPTWSQAGPTPPVHGQAPPGLQAPAPGAVHPSTGLPSTSPGHPSPGPAHPPAPTSQHPQAAPSPGSPHQPTSPRPDATPQPTTTQPRPSGPPTRTTDPSAPTPPRSTADAPTVGRPAAGEPPADGARPRPATPDTPSRPAQAADLPNRPDPAARPEVAPAGRAADNVTTQKISGLPSAADARPARPGADGSPAGHQPEPSTVRAEAPGGGSGRGGDDLGGRPVGAADPGGPPPRETWVDPPHQPRPQVDQARVHQVDLTTAGGRGSQTPFASRTDLAPNSQYQVTSHNGIQLDCYTDATGKVTYVETVYGQGGNLNWELMKPQADTTYVVHPDGGTPGEYTHIFRTDHAGRTVEASTNKLHTGEAPRGSTQGTVGKQANAEAVQAGRVVHDADGVAIPYEGGHLLANWFGGGTERVNLVGMLKSVNRGPGDSFGNLESSLATAVSQGKHVEVRVGAVYDDSGKIPSEFRVVYSIDGIPYTPPPFLNK